jgi:Peptidase S24-like
MNLRPQAVRMVLAHNLPVVIEVTSDSMTPSIERGTKVKVEPAPGELLPGDIALIIVDDGRDMLLHRVMHVFSSAGEQYVIHQGDAETSTFATCARDAIVGRAVAFALAPSRPLPVPEPEEAEARTRFRRRRRACALFAIGRRFATTLNVSENRMARQIARAYRAVARRFAG